MLYKQAIANTRKFVNSGKEQQLTLANLSAMALTAEGVKVTQDFRNDLPIVGRVICAAVVGDEMIAEIDADIPMADYPLYFVTAVNVDDYRLVYVAVTAKPAMVGIPEI